MSLENLADTMLECHTTAAQIASSAPREAAVLMVACKEAVAGQFPKRSVERVGPVAQFHDDLDDVTPFDYDTVAGRIANRAWQEHREQRSAEVARQRAEAALAYFDGPQVAREAQCIVEQYDDAHFTGEDASEPCECEKDEFAVALYLHREGVQQLHDWPTIASGLAEYNRRPKWERKSWLDGRTIEAEAVRGYFALLQYVEATEALCPSAKHYQAVELDIALGKAVEVEVPETIGRHATADKIQVERGTFTPVFETEREVEGERIVTIRKTHAAANDKAISNADRWNTAEWRRLSWPVVSFQHHYRERGYTGGRLDGDGTRGFRADPTWIASEQRLESEYHLPRVESVDGQMVIRRGHTQREYKRRVWCEANGRLVLPWMSSKAFAFHARFLRAADRRRLLRKRQRAQIARLVTALGGDLHDPAVVSWVKEHGYEVALDKLRARARREGVGLYA